MKTVLSKKTFKFLGIVQDVLYIFGNQCCDLNEKIIKLLNERSDN